MQIRNQTVHNSIVNTKYKTVIVMVLGGIELMLFADVHAIQYVGFLMKTMVITQ